MGESYLKKRAGILLELNPAIKHLFKVAIWLVILFELIKLIPPVVFSKIIDEVATFDVTKGLTFELVAGLLVAYFISMFLMTIVEWITKRIVLKKIIYAEVQVALGMFRKLLALDLQYHEEHNTGVSANKLLRGSSRVVELLYNLAESLLPIFFQAVITLVFLFFISWEIGLAFLLFVPIFVFALIHGSKKTQVLRERYHAYHDRFAGVVGQSLVNIRTVKDFYNEEKEYKHASKWLHKFMHTAQERMRVGLRSMVIEDSLVNLGRLLTLFLAVWLLFDLRITVGALVLIMTLTEKAYINLGRLSRVYYRIQDTEPALDRFDKIRKEHVVLQDNPAAPYNVKKGEISFENVSFSYPDDPDTAALKGVSFAIEPKKTIAVVGRSGGGKTTIVKLLLRHYDVTKGKVLIDGRDIREYSLKNLRDSMTIVSQDVELFDDTIMNNIAYGVPNVKKKDVIKVAKMAHAHEFIKDFPYGYDTVIGERGVKLSGGQKQRLAIARALLRKPKIMIFDEATSSLDSESEKCIHESIFNLSGKLTLIIIAHRFSTIEHADNIILLEKGKVAEIGTHKELIQKKGIFAKLRKLQKLGEVIE